MPHSPRNPHQEKRRVDDALDVLRHALVEYLTALPRTSRRAYGSADLQALLMAFIDRFVELVLPRRARTLAFAAKDARNEVAHYTGVMAPEDALRHLSNIRQLLKDLDASSALTEVDSIYNEQLKALRARDDDSPGVAVEQTKSPAAVTQSAASTQRVDVPHGKYGALHRHLNAVVEDQWTATFQDVEAILGRSLPRSARQHRPWWGNSRSHGHARAWLDAGWRIQAVDLSSETLSFVRSSNATSRSSHGPDRGVIHFDGADGAYFAWLARNPHGYVVNVRRRCSPDYVVLHRASCGLISNPRDEGCVPPPSLTFCTLPHTAAGRGVRSPRGARTVVHRVEFPCSASRIADATGQQTKLTFGCSYDCYSEALHSLRGLTSCDSSASTVRRIRRTLASHSQIGMGRLPCASCMPVSRILGARYQTGSRNPTVGIRWLPSTPR